MGKIDFPTIKDRVNVEELAERFLSPIGNGYICPVCGSGTGPNHSPAFSVTADGKRWTCFSCGAGGDCFDFIGVVDGITDKGEQARQVCEIAGLPVPSIGSYTPQSPRKPMQPAKDYTAGRKAWAKRLEAGRPLSGEALAYITGRGFTEGEAVAFGFSAVDYRGARVALPWRGTDYYATLRALDETAGAKYIKPKADEVGSQLLENPAALASPVVFLVEGALDAYAVAACDGASIACGGVASVDRTLKEIAARGYGGRLVLLFDADKAGQDATAKGIETGRSLGLTVLAADITTTGAHDPADLLATGQSGRDALAAILSESASQPLPETVPAPKNPSDGRTGNESAIPDAPLWTMASDIIRNIQDSGTGPRPMPTGLDTLDAALNGGLRPGLAVLGATSSAGKTTLCVQIADYVASQGTPVLFVALEQSGRELAAKSISRFMADGEQFEGVPAWAILDGSERAKWTSEKAWHFELAASRYSLIGEYLAYFDPMTPPTVETITTVAHAYAEEHGAAPLVIVDYLQLIAPSDPRDTDKRAVDYNVSALRRLARDLDAPVLTISSLNRASYNGAISLSSFKESGGIEYSADLVLAMQPAGIADEIAQARPQDRDHAARLFSDAARRQDVRHVEVSILKHRNGALCEPIPLTFHTRASRFDTV